MPNELSASQSLDVLVVGAGIVGIACAMHLQREGLSVALLDRAGPGEATSSGNAGGIAISEVIPLATPGIIWKVPGWLLDPTGPLALRWRHLPRLAPWLFGFWRASARATMLRNVAATVALAARAREDLAPLLRNTGAEDLIAREDALCVWETEAGWQRDSWAWDLRRARGVAFEMLDQAGLRALEPDLSPAFTRGIQVPGFHHVRNPLRLSRLLAAAFRERGGRLLVGQADALHPAPEHVAVRLADGTQHAARHVVVACGAWSHHLARTLGDRFPLETERGYHMMLAEPGIGLRRQISLREQGFVMTPMEEGLRLAGTVELASLDAPPDWRRSEILVAKARRALPRLSVGQTSRWMGHRPALSDGLPVIDRSPRHERVVYAFGHGHLGLTLSGVTGAQVAALVTGRRPSVDLAPFRAGRFTSAGAAF